MDWMQQVGGLLNAYANGSGDQTRAVSDFDDVARAAPRDAMRTGLADAFRSSQTPPFASMLSQIFGRSGGTQRASVLNALISTLGPALVARVLAQRGAAVPPQIQSGQAVAPEVAEQIPPDAVEALAREAEQKDPSIVERISDFYADQPALIKTLGGAALVVAMAKIAQAQTRK
jgi:hypothetical protein